MVARCESPGQLTARHCASCYVSLTWSQHIRVWNTCFPFLKFCSNFNLFQKNKIHAYYVESLRPKELLARNPPHWTVDSFGHQGKLLPVLTAPSLLISVCITPTWPCVLSVTWGMYLQWLDCVLTVGGWLGLSWSWLDKVHYGSASPQSLLRLRS